jgi:hypothetical protein
MMIVEDVHKKLIAQKETSEANLKKVKYCNYSAAGLNHRGRKASQVAHKELPIK